MHMNHINFNFAEKIFLLKIAETQNIFTANNVLNIWFSLKLINARFCVGLQRKTRFFGKIFFVMLGILMN